MAKHAYQEIFKIIHPHAVKAVKLGGKPVGGDILSGIWGFFFLYLALYGVAALILAGLGMDVISALSAVAAATLLGGTEGQLIRP